MALDCPPNPLGQVPEGNYFYAYINGVLALIETRRSIVYIAR